MSTFSDSLRRWRTERPNQLLAVGVGLFVLVAAGAVGLRARSASAELSERATAWQQTANQLATLQQQFRVPSSSESSRLIAESARMGALGVPPSERVSLLEFLTRLADAAKLSEVRVNVRAGTDSAFIPPRSIGTGPVNPAAYSVTVDFTGSFAGLVQFVSNLPPSVSVSRLGAARSLGHTAYHVGLSVYELPNGDTAG